MHILTEAELCKLLKVSRQTIWRLRRDVGFPFYRVGNRYRYRLEEVQECCDSVLYSPPHESSGLQWTLVDSGGLPLGFQNIY